MNIKKLLLCTATGLMCLCTSVFAETIMNTDKCSFNGTWSNATQTAYQEGYPLFANGTASASWKISEGGVFRLYYWKTVDPENGAKNVRLNLSAEAINFNKESDFSSGNSGWNEFGIGSNSGAGGTFTMSSDDGTIYASAIKIVPLDSEYTSLLNFVKRYDKHILLLANQSNCYVDGVQYQIPDVVPEIIDGTTYVPLRFVTEALGGEVEWTSGQAIIKFNDNSMIFSSGSDRCTVNGEEYQISGNVYTENDRLMLPLRFISEKLGKKVLWSDTGLIMITDNEPLDLNAESMMVNNIVKIMKKERK